MLGKIFNRGRHLISAPQSSVLSAASIIMIMMAANGILGLIKGRTLNHFLLPEQVGLFFAAFRVPDTVFQLLVVSTFSSSFIPIFTKAFHKDEKEAWDLASRVINLGFAVFLPIAVVFILLAQVIYKILTPSFSAEEIKLIANMSQLLFIAQGFFVISYVLTGILESSRRFLIPALAPLFYNLGTIVGTILLAPRIGIYGPVIGTIFGSFLHFMIQFPVAYKVGFKFSFHIKPTQSVKFMAKLSAPRLAEMIFSQIAKTFELYLASFISSASIAYLTLANTLQVFPVSFVGIPLAKAALPTLSRLNDNPEQFKKTFLATLYQIIFLSSPLATLLIVLRIPAVRLVFGANYFDWEATVQTGLVVSSFAFSIPFQAAVALLSRAFYALHNTKIPVVISIICGIITTALGFIFVKSFGFPVWSLAFAFSVSSLVQSIALLLMLSKKLHINFFTSLVPLYKSLIAALVSGTAMFFLLKFFDRSVWVKRLSFLGSIDSESSLAFRRFVLDTRYTFNLVVLTVMVSAIGLFLYFGISFLLKSQELASLIDTLKRHRMPLLQKDGELVTPTRTDSSVS